MTMTPYLMIFRERKLRLFSGCGLKLKANHAHCSSKQQARWTFVYMYAAPCHFDA